MARLTLSMPIRFGLDPVTRAVKARQLPTEREGGQAVLLRKAGTRAGLGRSRCPSRSKRLSTREE
jgi:hypothetical protein